MSERVVVDPITRIEGHLRIEVQTDGDRITEAWSSGTMVRGIEIILKGRDPRDAWAFANEFVVYVHSYMALPQCALWKRH